MRRRVELAGGRDVVIGAIVLGAVLLVVVGIFSGTVAKLFDTEDRMIVRAQFRDAQQLRVGSDVRLDGVAAGVIDDLTLAPDGRTTTVTMKVNRTAGSLYENASAVLRFKTVLGGVFYVDLERGSPDRPTLGDTMIPTARTARQVEVDDVTAALKGGAQSGLQTLPGELADTFRNHDAPAELLATATEASPGLVRGLNALRGQRTDRDLQELLENTGDTVRALDSPRDDIRTVVQGAAATLQTTAARSDEVRTLLRISPPAGDEINATLDRLRTTLDVVDPLVSKLERPAGAVAPTFAAVRPVLVDARGLLNQAVPLLRSLRPAARSLAVTARSGRTLLDGLTPSIDRTNDTILPMLSEVDPATEKSTAVMIGGTFAGLGSGAGGQMDANGHFIRFPATTGSSPVNSLPCQLYINNPDAPQMLACGELSQAISTYLNYQPLSPSPGTAPPPPPPPARSKKEGKP